MKEGAPMKKLLVIPVLVLGLALSACGGGGSSAHGIEMCLKALRSEAVVTADVAKNCKDSVPISISYDCATGPEIRAVRVDGQQTAFRVGYPPVKTTEIISDWRHAAAGC
jgi:hypothetical protein